jgi:hypothetical protein
MLFIDNNGRIGFVAIFFVYFFPIVIVIAYHYMMESTFKPDPEVALRAKAL